MWESTHFEDPLWPSQGERSRFQGGQDRYLDPAEAERWNEAYVTVESYFRAMGLRHALRLSRLIYQALDRAERRVAKDPGLAPTSAAMEETLILVGIWFSQAVGMAGGETDRLTTRGRLAMFLADLPGKYQDSFLSNEPLSPAVVAAMKESYLKAGPQFQQRYMSPCTVKLNPIMKRATQWWEGLSRAPIAKMAIRTVVLAGAGAAVLLFFWR